MTMSASHTGRAIAWMPRGGIYALGCAVVLRSVLSLVAAWVLSLHPLRETSIMRMQYLGLPVQHDLILGPWQRFDAFWYLRIALQGYGAHDGSTVYYPLYPLLIKAVSLVLGGHALLAALLVSNLCFCGLLIVLYALVAGRYDEGAARRTLLFLCLFPTASFLLGAYTESLFLLLAAGSFLAAGRGRIGLAGVLGCLAALTRLQGVVLVLPLLWIAGGEWRSGRRGIALWGAALLPACGTLLFMCYTRFVIGAGSITSVYSGQVHQQLAPPWVTVARYWTALAAHHWRLFAYQTGNWVDAMNLLLALGMLAIVLPARRLLGMPLWLYAVSTWAVTLCIHQSTARYMLTVFPALIVLAVVARGRRLAQLALLLCMPLMLFVAAEFVRWSFVG